MLNYRPDIDGLRAIAVASVVLYHLSKSLLPGGFVGVDIFFVISGYLITKLISKELTETSKFSFKTFYLRRVRRLFPALFATLLLSVALAYYLLSPADLIAFSKSLIAAVFSVSNLFFWSEAGYFDTDSSLKPLLHTWSLSVEEQFYFIWPAVLVGLFALNRPRLIPIFVLVVGLLSWLFNEWFFSQQATITSWFGTKDNQSALDIASTAFYWLPFRVFEFSIGAILVWLPKPAIRWKLSAELLFVVGLSMVAWSMIGFDDGIEFPSSAALLPCIGAGLMIYSGPSHGLSLLVSNRVMVGVGLISYSLYLIHWPLIVFYKYYVGDELNALEGLSLGLLALVLAYLMYRFIEQPFRKTKSSSEPQVENGQVKRSSPNKAFLRGACVCTTLIVLASVSALISKGWLFRYPAEVVAQLSYKKGDYTEYFWTNIKGHETGFSNSGKPKILVVGDSMAAGLMNVLVAADAKTDIDLASISVRDNCKTLFGLSAAAYQHIYSGAKEICRQEHQRILSKLDLLSEADTVILASYWWDENHLKYVPKSTAHMKALTNARLMVLGLKVQRSDGIWFLSKHAFKPQVDKLRTTPHPKALKINQMLEKQADGYDYFDMLNLFCNSDGCQRVTKDGFAIVFDTTHFSENGARFAAQNVKNTGWYRSLLEKSK